VAKKKDTAGAARDGSLCTDLGARLREKGLEPLYLVEGPEAYLRERAIALLRALAGSAPAETQFDGAKTEAATVLDELRTLPFFASVRLVHVTDAQEFLTRNAEALEPFLDLLGAAGATKSALILESDGLDGRLRISKRVRELAVRVACETPDEAGILRFIRERAKARGRSFAPGADGALLERFAGGAGVQVSLGILDGEVAKLCSGGDGPITLEQVLAIASSLSAEDTFAVVHAVGRGDTRAALEALAAVFRDGAIVDGERKREPKALAPMLLGLLAWDLGRLFKARALLDAGRTGNDVVSELRAWRERDSFLARAHGATDPSLRRAHALLREADALLKEAGEPYEVMTGLVARLSLAAAQPGRRPARAPATSGRARGT
jgi:DNA polymerase III delta subunit